MKRGVTLEELNRLFDFLKQSKANDEMTVLITNDMCKSLYDLMENCFKYQDKLQSNWNSLREWVQKHYDEYKDMEQDAMFEFGLMLDKMNKLEGKDNNGK